MAISVTNRTNNYDNTTDPSTSYTTASVTIAAGSGVLLAVATSHGTLAAPTITPSGLSLTWTEEANLTYSSSSVRRVQVWGAYAASGGSGTITLTLSGNVPCTGCAWSVNEVTGMDTSDLFLQPTTNSGNGTTATVNLSAASDSNNRSFLWQAHRTNTASTEEATWTELSDNANNAPNMGHSAGWKSDAFDTSCTATWTGAAADWGAIALEIKIGAAAAAAPVVEFVVPSVA